jgi:Zn finger protein HypA/HybF involved in hydrogenase expression
MHPELVDEYSDRNDLPVTEVNTVGKQRFWWTCRDCGNEWETFLRHRLNGHGCQKCGSSKATATDNLKTTHPELVAEYMAINKYAVDKVRAKTHSQLNWKCKNCEHEWQASGFSRVNGAGCPMCTGLYPAWEQASAAAIALGIKSSVDYYKKKRYKEDARLPSQPSITYRDFPGWKVFLKRSSHRDKYYATWKMASAAAIALGCTSSRDYGTKYTQDPKLHGAPHEFYKDFPGWRRFLGRNKYETWQEAGKAARALGLTSHTKYFDKKKYKQDPRLPSNPNIIYSDFPGWTQYLSGSDEE